MSRHAHRRGLEGARERWALTATQEAARDPAQRDREFRPVEGGDAVASGETLLIEAYAVVWMLLFAFVWLSWRRQGRIDTRIAELERSLAAARGNQLK